MSMIMSLYRVSQNELDKYKENSNLLEEKLSDFESENFNMLDIDKSWDGILFLLNGEGSTKTEHPLTKVFFSKKVIDSNQDLGYGPAYYLEPDEVIEINNIISTLSEENLRSRFNPQLMEQNEVYPSIWVNDSEAFSYLFDNFKVVQEIYSLAAKNNQAIITFLY